MAGELTVSERILYHLSNYVKYEDKYEAPFDVTQDGISQACSISRAHAAIELKKLKASGIVDETLKHVRKGKARRKVYFLTTIGKSKATDVLQYVRDNSIVPMVDPAKISAESISRSKSIRRSSPLPTVKDFFGRSKELEAVSQALALPTLKVLSIRGIAGIGKSTLVAKVVSGLSGQRIFWYSTKPWDVPRTLADALGRFLAENGSRRLATYLASGKFELGELSYLFDEELAENGYTLVFDDVDSSDNLQEFLKMLKHSSGSAKMIVTSEAGAKFYDASDMIAKKEVAEIELGGLEKRAAIELLRSRNIEGHMATRYRLRWSRSPVPRAPNIRSPDSSRRSSTPAFLKMRNLYCSSLQFSSSHSRPMRFQENCVKLGEVRCSGRSLREDSRFMLPSAISSTAL